MKVLVGDVGATNSRFSIWDGALGRVFTWPTALDTGLRDALRRLPPDLLSAADVACVGVAGPVLGPRARLTRVPWTAHTNDLPVPGLLVNDLHAAAASLRHLPARGVIALGGPPLGGGPAVVLGMGTGLGEALALGATVLPGEGGHAYFSPADAEQAALRAWLAQRLGAPDRPAPVRWEDVLSGTGLGAILRFVCQHRSPSAALAAALAAAASDEAAAALVTSLRDPCCDAAAELFVRCAAAEARNAALRVIATGGVWLTGGIPPRLTGMFRSLFRSAFDGEGVMRPLLDRVPTRLVVSPVPALIGAGVLGRAFGEGGPQPQPTVPCSGALPGGSSVVLSPVVPPADSVTINAESTK